VHIEIAHRPFAAQRMHRSIPPVPIMQEAQTPPLKAATAPRGIDARTLAFREWIAAILERQGITRTELARRANLSHSLLSRATTDDSHRINFRADTIAKLTEVGGVAPPAILSPNQPQPLRHNRQDGMAEPEAVAYVGPQDETLTPNQSLWTAKSGSLQAMGLMPGDRFKLDQGEAPRNRDSIVVQKYDHHTGTAETLLRLYVDGFAVTPLHLIDNEARIWLDGSNATCMGVIVKSWRTRI
jgi:transcriptional regulator with XRE-family HTH domain